MSYPASTKHLQTMDNKDDDLDSMCSSFSTVSFNGEEISADKAVDESLRDIQQATNDVHCLVRNMLTSDERSEGWEVMKPMYDEIDENVQEALSLWKELRNIAKQLLPPKPRASKASKKTEASVLDSCG